MQTYDMQKKKKKKKKKKNINDKSLNLAKFVNFLIGNWSQKVWQILLILSLKMQNILSVKITTLLTHTLVNWGHLRMFLLLPDLKMW